MKAYVISILGITICGVLIEIILPSGSTSKYVKSIYAVFVIAVILNPVIQFFAKNKGLDIKYNDMEISDKLIDYINTQKVESVKSSIILELNQQGAENVDIILNFEQQNNQIIYKSCIVDLKNLTYTPSDKHISKYELIIDVIKQHTNLTDEVIIFNEWQRKKIQI